ncbi:MAG: proline dehydrogenase family protein [Bacteroidota bacterium]|nr:proline dehydrogenase family protein [Bacteroidota bacterium]
MPGSLIFSNTSKAYPHKSVSELKQTVWMFKMLNSTIGKIGKSFLKWAINWHLPIRPIIKATLYKHFVGGEALEDSLIAVEKLNEFGVRSLLDYSEEAQDNENGFGNAFRELERNIIFASKHPALPFSAFKITAIGHSGILEKKSKGDELTGLEEEGWAKIQSRVARLCQAAADNGVYLLIDAEESWIQPAIDELANDMMAKHNRQRVSIINTYQLYRKDRLDALKSDFNRAVNEGYLFGAKPVRGAYQVKEHKRADEKGYRSPIQDSKAETDQDYNEAVSFCIKNLEKTLLVVATHNEESTRLAADLALSGAYPKNHNHLWFSQLYGMCDHLSFNLAGEGYNVVKYVPYGPVHSVTPYLIRRAEENSSVEGQAMKEINLLKKEIARRKMAKA